MSAVGPSHLQSSFVHSEKPHSKNLSIMPFDPAFDFLSNEMTFLIFSLFSWKGKLTFSEVCQKWKSLTNDWGLWQREIVILDMKLPEHDNNRVAVVEEIRKNVKIAQDIATYLQAVIFKKPPSAPVARAIFKSGVDLLFEAHHGTQYRLTNEELAKRTQIQIGFEATLKLYKLGINAAEINLAFDGGIENALGGIHQERMLSILFRYSSLLKKHFQDEEGYVQLACYFAHEGFREQAESITEHYLSTASSKEKVKNALYPRRGLTLQKSRST